MVVGLGVGIGVGVVREGVRLGGIVFRYKMGELGLCDLDCPMGRGRGARSPVHKPQNSFQ